MVVWKIMDLNEELKIYSRNKSMTKNFSDDIICKYDKYKKLRLY